MIQYTTSLDGITPEQLQGFFDGWPNPPAPDTHLRLLRGSYRAVLAVHEGRVVGFVNAVSDGVLSAYIPLLEVLPEQRGRGVGSELVRLMLAELAHLYMIDVLCDPDVQPFYARLGLQPARGMMIRNYARQSGTS